MPHVPITGCLVTSRKTFRDLKKRRKLPAQMQFRDDNALDPYWVCNACVELATRTDSASDEEEPPAKKARVHGSSTSGEPFSEKAQPGGEAAAPKAAAAKFVRNVDVVQDPEAAAAKLGGLAHKLKITRQKLARRDRRLVVVTDRSRRARETLQELGPIVAGQRALARAGEGSALKNFCTGFLNGKFSIDTIYFQDFAFWANLTPFSLRRHSGGHTHMGPWRCRYSHNKSAPTRKGDVHHKKMGRTAAYAEEARHGPRPPGGG